jgi:hypothetical protein
MSRTTDETISAFSAAAGQTVGQSLIECVCRYGGWTNGSGYCLTLMEPLEKVRLDRLLPVAHVLLSQSTSHNTHKTQDNYGHKGRVHVCRWCGAIEVRA